MGFPWVDDIVEAAVDIVEDVVEEAADVIVDAGEVVVGAAVDVGEVAVGFAGDSAEFAANLADDTVLDAVDFVTAGGIDIDYDDGTFSADVGIDGVANLGLAISEDGVEATLEGTLVNAELGITDDGFSAGASGGINFGPLPYAEGNIEVTADGDVVVHGYAQGTVPLPTGGILSGHAGVDFAANDAGWGASLDAAGTYTLPSGTAIGGGVQAGYMETADGDSHTTLGLQGSLSSPGIGSVGGGVGYDRVEQDGVVVEQVHAEGHAQGFGASIDATADYVGVETAQGSYSDWSGDVDIKGLDAEAVAKLGSSLLGLDNETVNGVLGKVAENGDLATLLGGLDPATTEALIGQLVGAPAAAGQAAATPTATGFVDPGASTTTATDLLSDDLLGTDVLGGGSPAADPTSGLPGSDLGVAASADTDTTDPMLSDDPVSGADGTDSTFDDSGDSGGYAEPEPAYTEPEPAYDSQDDFSQAISSADQVGTELDSSVDDMFGDLG